jgi:hypothetical protein
MRYRLKPPEAAVHGGRSPPISTLMTKYKEVGRSWSYNGIYIHGSESLSSSHPVRKTPTKKRPKENHVLLRLSACTTKSTNKAAACPILPPLGPSGESPVR